MSNTLQIRTPEESRNRLVCLKASEPVSPGACTPSLSGNAQAWHEIALFLCGLRQVPKTPSEQSEAAPLGLTRSGGASGGGLLSFSPASKEVTCK